MIHLFDRVENIVEKGENAITHYAVFSCPAMFTKVFLFNTSTDEKILDGSKLKQIADTFESAFKMKNKCHRGRKHCEKRRNCLLQSLVRQNVALCGNWLRPY